MSNSNIDPKLIDSLLDSMSEILIEIGSDLKILRANKAIESALHLNMSGLEGESALDFAALFTPASTFDGNMSDALKYSNGTVSGDCTFQRSDGKELYLSWVLSPLRIRGAEKGRLLTFVDLTDRRELRVALLHEREDFLAVLNHRLRTPLLASDRILQLILEGQFGGLSPKQSELLSLVAENVTEINRLMLMIMDIYRYRSSTKSLTYRDVEVGDFFNELLANIETKHAVLSLNIGCPETSLHCDPIQVKNMLSHVIENALKYAKSMVEIHVSNEANDCLKILVKDDGPGIVDADIKNLFERFYLVSSSGKYAPVTGAGLCLCNEIAKAHSGKISCKSQVGVGTSFEILLPCKAVTHDTQ